MLASICSVKQADDWTEAKKKKKKDNEKDQIVGNKKTKSQVEQKD